MTDRIMIQLTVNVRAESAVSGNPICTHSSIIKETIDPQNLVEAQRSLISLLCDTAKVIKKIGE